MEISGKYPISSRQIYLNSKDAEKINPEFTSDCFFFFKEIIADCKFGEMSKYCVLV